MNSKNNDDADVDGDDDDEDDDDSNDDDDDANALPRSGNFELLSMRQRRIKKFNTIAKDYSIRVSGLDTNDSYEGIIFQLSNIFAEMLAILLDNVQAHDRVRISISGSGLREIWIPFIPPHELTVERILTEVEKVCQSNDKWIFHGELNINFIHAIFPVGGRKTKGLVNVEKRVKNEKCFISIENKDNLCLARAIIVAKSKIDNHTKYSTIKRGGNLQDQLAQELHATAGIQHTSKCGLEEIKNYQKALNGYQLIVYSSSHFNEMVYMGPEASKRIYIYHYNSHFAVITTMSAFLNKSYFCVKCNKGFNNYKKHFCENTCACCRSPDNCLFVAWIICKNCQRIFKNQECFNKHQVKNNVNRSVCDIYRKCKECHVTIDSRTTHKCHMSYCQTCRDHLPKEHKCFLPTLPKTKPPKTMQTIYFDFECRQDDILPTDNNENNHEYVHKPNLCIANLCCIKCGTEVSINSPCDICGLNKEEKIFKGESCAEDFCEWLFDGSKKGSVVIAHNNRGYDSYFIFQYLHKNGIKPERVVHSGQKMIAFEAKGLRFLDSLSFLPMSLAQLPKTFGIDELKKGYFPHFFNRKENQSYTGPYPAVTFYDPDSMLPMERETFFHWYRAQDGKIFDFQEELISYCRSDVNILRRCCNAFINIFQTTTGINPFEKNVTIASVCNRVYRQNFMPKDSIASIPPYGYLKKENYSHIAIVWLEWLMATEKVKIQHARNGGEKVIESFKLDGFDPVSNTCYEFEGCYFHGCELCYPNGGTINKKIGCTMRELHERTLFRRKYLQEHCGKKVVHIKECQFRAQIRDNEELREFAKGMSFHDPLNPRDAFFGGRTNALALYYQCPPNESIKYVDFTSLYPWVCKYQHFPKGHPKILTGELLVGVDPLSCEGLIKCTVLPPRKLYLPVLPARIDKKLKFVLCKKCSETRSALPCSHSDAERLLTGTWVIFELKKAVELGYKIIEVAEIWHFPETCIYDKDTKTGGLFSGYIDEFLKIKQEASGWPDWVKTQSDKNDYLADYYTHEGIELDENAIEHNAGLRNLAKLCLVSLWGKLGQRPTFVKSSYISEPLEYFQKLTDNTIEVSDVRMLNDEYVLMKYIEKEEFVECSENTNVIIAAYVTAHGRLKLYSELEKLGENVLYFDTDSIIYREVPGAYKPPLGDYLGDFKDELNGNTISEFLSGGPKNYAYKLKVPDKNGIQTVCKVRGFTLNFRSGEKVNFHSMKELILGKNFDSKISVDIPHKIKRKDDFQIVSCAEKKNYRLVYDKRYLYNDDDDDDDGDNNGFFTRPFGY